VGAGRREENKTLSSSSSSTHITTTRDPLKKKQGVGPAAAARGNQSWSTKFGQGPIIEKG